MRYLNAEAPPVPPEGAPKVHVVSRTGILPQADLTVNPPCPCCAAAFDELVAARNLITVYEQTAIRKAKLRKYLYGTKSLAMTKGGRL